MTDRVNDKQHFIGHTKFFLVVLIGNFQTGMCCPQHNDIGTLDTQDAITSATMGS